MSRLLARNLHLSQEEEREREFDEMLVKLKQQVTLRKLIEIDFLLGPDK